MAKYDYLIVGAGLFGSTFAYKATQNNKRCLVIDKRNYTGGNIHCENIAGITVHQHGPHIFHTNERRIWDFVNNLVEFDNFIHEPLANYKGELFNLPFNMSTFHQLWKVNTPREAKNRMNMSTINLDSINNLEELALSQVGYEIYEKFIKYYTEKQWNKSCQELPIEILARIPIRYTYNNNYFDDNWSGIPRGGYNRLIDKMLEGSEIRLGIDFSNIKDHWTDYADNLVYTGRIDEFYDFKFGKLEYRSLEFKHEILNIPDYQGVAVINFTDNKNKFTRIIEHKHFEPKNWSQFQLPTTVITREYPRNFDESNIPYYPVPISENKYIYMKYKKLASKESNIIFGGRLAEYSYFNMDQVIRRALYYWS